MDDEECVDEQLEEDFEVEMIDLDGTGAVEGEVNARLDGSASDECGLAKKLIAE